MPDTEKQWTDDAAKLLVGKKIAKVSYMTKEEAEHMGWYQRPIIIELDDGTTLMPSSDDEGNGGGSIFTSDDELPTIPVL